MDKFVGVRYASVPASFKAAVEVEREEEDEVRNVTSAVKGCGGEVWEATEQCLT